MAILWEGDEQGVLKKLHTENSMKMCVGWKRFKGSRHKRDKSNSVHANGSRGDLRYVSMCQSRCHTLCCFREVFSRSACESNY